MSTLGDSLRQAKTEASKPQRTLPPPDLPRQTSRPPRAAGSPPALPNAALHSRYLNQEELERFENLLVFAATTVEGYLAGKHRSPHFGFSSEFVEHKPYARGDDIEHIDWQVYARTRKLYSRKYLEETDMTVHLLLDASPSMTYNGAKRELKQARAKRLAAALAYLMLKQGDKAALGLFTDRLVEHVPPGSTRRHLFRLLQTLEHAAPDATRTDPARALMEAAAQMRKRGRLVLVSDFLGVDTEAMFDALGLFTHRGFEVMLVQVLDPEEITLPDVNLARFHDMETGQQIQVEPEEIRAAYEREVAALIETLRVRSMRRRITFSTHRTDTPYLDAIEEYMQFRRR
jgi:uncharacterized protein (DUF58 family)